MLLAGFICSFFTGKTEAAVNAVFDGASGAVELCIGLLGVMCLWSGIVKIAENSGLTNFISEKCKPFIRLLFPGISKDDKAVSAVVMNMAANFLGLGNAATPMGIKACREIKRVQIEKYGFSGGQDAGPDMCMFIIINTASIQLIPATTIALASAAGSVNPGNIMLPVWITSSITFFISVVMAKIMAGVKQRSIYRLKLNKNRKRQRTEKKSA